MAPQLKQPRNTIRPTPREFYAGKMADGSPIAPPSMRLYKAWKADLPVEEHQDELRRAMDDIVVQCEYEQLSDYDEIRAALRDVIALGREEIAANAATAAPEPIEGDCPRPLERSDNAASGLSPFSGPIGGQSAHSSSPCSDSRGQSPARQKSGQSPARPMTRMVAMMAAIKLLMTVTAARTNFVRELVERASARDKKAEFLEDRTVGVVKQTLLALDKVYSKVGFGSWMPFRFPDQWLMFCGVMSRVLAANGLMYASSPEAYRKLLEETPPVEGERWGGDAAANTDKGSGTNSANSAEFEPDPNFKTPKAWGLCEPHREVPSLSELFNRVDSS